jgi:uncharacterized protein YkwD
MIRRLVVLVFSVVVASSGCALSPAGDATQVEGTRQLTTVTHLPVSDGLRIVRQTATTTVPVAPTTSAPAAPTTSAPAERVIRVRYLTSVPDHLRDRTGEQPVQDGPHAVTDATAGSEASSPAPSAEVPPSPTAAPPSPAPVTSEPPPPAPVTTEPPPPSAPAPTTTTTPPPPTTSPPVASGSAAGQFASSINALRAEVGVGALTRNGDLDGRAQAWAESMAASGVLGHSGIVSTLVSGGWSIAGENVGYGPSVESVFAALRASSSHYSNMVDARFTSLGVGVVVDANGVVWTTHLFGG